MRFPILCALLVCCGALWSPVQAAEKRLAASGDWVALRVDVPFAAEKGNTLIFKNLCTARTGGEAAYFSVSILPDGTTLVQITSEQWDWPGRRRNAKVVAGKVNVTLQDALYWDDFIDHGTLAAHGGYSSMQMLSGQPGQIEVFDHRDRLLARFSSRGFNDMLRRAIRCAEDG